MFPIPESITSKYKLIKPIGSGSIGNVSLFENKTNKEQIVIKSILKVQLEEEKIQKIRNEINYMRQFSKYENSTKLIDCIEDDYNIYLLMEYCELNLDEYVKKRMNEKKPLNINEIKDILVQLNNILKIMFSNKIAHRDLKPSNILLKKIDDNNFIFKLCDYGNAKNVNNNIQSSFKGTAIFKAPEILNNNKNYDPIKADLWCIGIIIYFMLKGEYPFISDVDINKEKNKLGIKITNSNELNDLFKKLTIYNPEKRISFIDYFNNPFFNFKKNIKIVFLGGPYCGKTCIINKICLNTFNVECPTTVGFGVNVKLYINLYKFRL